MATVDQLQVLFPVWELEPFLKVGGLGELARALPRALADNGVDIRIVMPYYQALKLYGQKRAFVGKVTVKFDKRPLIISIYKIHLPHKELPVYLLKHRYLSKINPNIFAVFCLAIIAGLKAKAFEFDPSIIHCNDHHTALLPLIIKLQHLPYKTLLTIHSMFSQSKQPRTMAVKLGIDPKECHFLEWEIKKNQFNYLLEGILHADMINTVSPTYAKEMLTEPEGRDLEEFINRANDEGRFLAIINGIDYELKNPETNPKLKHHFSSNPDHVNEKVLSIDSGKNRNKLLLQRKLKLTADISIPMIGFIGRLSREQKGIDILHRMIVKWKGPPCQFVIMGQGQTMWEERYRSLAAFMPKQVSAITTYNDDLSPTIYSASDFIVVPSVFEPCGQVQMNAMRYGAIPIVHATGGLTDTVKDGVNGFVYYNANNTNGLTEAVGRALDIFSHVPNVFEALRTNAMRTDNSWDASARDYILVYKNLLVGNHLSQSERIGFVKK